MYLLRELVDIAALVLTIVVSVLEKKNDSTYDESLQDTIQTQKRTNIRRPIERVRGSRLTSVDVLISLLRTVCLC